MISKFPDLLRTTQMTLSALSTSTALIKKDVPSLAFKQITDHDYAPENFVALTEKVIQMKEQLQFSQNNAGNNKTGWSLMTYVLSASLFSSCYDHDEDFSNIGQISRLRNSILTNSSHKEYSVITQRSIICFELIPENTTTLDWPSFTTTSIANGVLSIKKSKKANFNIIHKTKNSWIYLRN